MPSTPSSLLDVNSPTAAPTAANGSTPANTSALAGAFGGFFNPGNTSSPSAVNTSPTPPSVLAPPGTASNGYQGFLQGTNQPYTDSNGVTINPQTQNGGVANPQDLSPKQSQGDGVSTATSSIQPASLAPKSGVLPNGTQTYKLDDGSIYDANGTMISQPGQNVSVSNSPTSGTPGFSADTPDVATGSSSLADQISNSDLAQLGQTNQNNETQLFSNLTSLFNTQQQAAAGIATSGTVGPQEQGLQQGVAQAGANVGQAQQQVMQDQGQQAGIINPNNQNIAAPFLTGQAANKLFFDQRNLMSAQIQQQLAQTSLAYAQGNRQVAYQSAVQLFDASNTNLTDAIQLYQAAAPKNIQTEYNQLTGDVNTQMINPLTGETYTVSNGNIGASEPLQNVSTSVNPMNGQITITGTNAASQGVSYTLDANGQIVSGQQTGTGAASGSRGSLVSNNINPQAIVGGYDLTSYAGASSATGTYGQDVNSIYQNIGQVSNAQQAQQYISSVNKNSPITGQMVMQASQQYGVDPSVMMAIMQKESSFGTAGMATSTFNPGNVGNNTGTKSTNWGNWQSGVNAVAQNLSERSMNASPATSTGSMINGSATPQQIIQQVISSQPQPIQNAIRKLADGTPYIDESQLSPSQLSLAEFASSAGIPAIDAGGAAKLQTITGVQKNLSDFQTTADAALGNLGWGAQYVNFAGLLANKVGGGTNLNDFNSFRTSAINTLQGLAGGSGSGLRINQFEINQAIDNIPSPTDTKAQADTKIQKLNVQLNNMISTIIPEWVAPQS